MYFYMWLTYLRYHLFVQLCTCVSSTSWAQLKEFCICGTVYVCCVCIRLLVGLVSGGSRLQYICNLSLLLIIWLQSIPNGLIKWLQSYLVWNVIIFILKGEGWWWYPIILSVELQLATPSFICTDIMIIWPCRALSSKLLVPLQSKIEEWKKTTSQLDKEHEKGMSSSGMLCSLLAYVLAAQ